MQSNNLVATPPSLEDATLLYWRLSRCLEGREPNVPTVEQALGGINKALNRLNPERPVARRLRDLTEVIVIGDDDDEIPTIAELDNPASQQLP